MRRAFTALSLSVAISAVAIPAMAQSSFNTNPAPPQYAEQVATSFYLPMRDGLQLAVSLHRPSVNGVPVEGPLPVIWHHALDIEPAGTFATDAETGGRKPLSELTRYGYVVAVVARRGNGASFGTRRGYEDFTEGFDAYEVTEWLADQAWSTGKVGMYGCSNTGEASMHAVVARPPSLKAVFAGCFSWDRYDGHTRGGLIAQYGTGPTRSIEDDLRATPVQGDEARVQLRQAAEQHVGSTNLLALMESMPYRDSWSPLVMARFWGEVSIGAYLHQVKASQIPIYVQGGWYDDFRTEGLITQANLGDQARTIIGPWRHCLNDDFNLRAEQVRFYDYHLNGIDTGIQNDDPILYYTIGADEAQAWRSTKTWPLADTDNRQLFISGANLTATAPRRAGQQDITVDYNPVCPPDPHPLNGGPFAQPCRSSADNVTVALAPFAQDTEITGNPLVDLWISSDNPEQPVFAYLEDVAPDGTVSVITDGRQRASLRKVVEAPWDTMGTPWRRAWTEDHQPLEAGVPVQVQFDMLAMSYVFKKGHTLRVSITGSDARERVRKSIEPAPTLSLHWGSQTPSSITLPFRPKAG